MPVGTPFGRRCSVNICSVCTPRFTDKAKSYQIPSTARGWTNPSACAKSPCSHQNLAFSRWEKPHGHGESDRICATRLHRGDPAIWCAPDVHCSMRWVHLLRENHGLKFQWRVKNDDSRASAHPMWLTSACYSNHEKRRATGVTNEGSKAIQPGIYDKQHWFDVFPFGS